MVSRSLADWPDRVWASAVGAVLWLGAALASWPQAGHALTFTLYVTLVLAAAALGLARRLKSNDSPVPVATCAFLTLAFPLVIHDLGRQIPLSGEGTFLVVTAIALVSFGAVLVIRGAPDRAVRKLSASMLVVVYVGFLGSYAVLLRQAERGHRLLLTVLLMAGLYRIVSYFSRRLVSGRYIVPGIPPQTWPGAAGGAVGCVMGALVGAALIGQAVPRMLILGMVVGVASVVGDLAGATLREALMEPGRGGRLGLVGRMDVVLVAAPATYYWFRLFLT